MYSEASRGKTVGLILRPETVGVLARETSLRFFVYDSSRRIVSRRSTPSLPGVPAYRGYRRSDARAAEGERNGERKDRMREGEREIA